MWCGMTVGGSDLGWDNDVWDDGVLVFGVLDGVVWEDGICMLCWGMECVCIELGDDRLWEDWCGEI